MKNVSKKAKVLFSVVCLVVITSFAINEAIASKKEAAAGWRKWDWRTESCVWGNSTCIIP